MNAAKTCVAAVALLAGLGISQAGAATIDEGSLGTIMLAGAFTVFAPNTASNEYKWAFTLATPTIEDYVSITATPVGNASAFSYYKLSLLASDGTVIASTTSSSPSKIIFDSVYAANLGAGDYFIDIIATARRAGAALGGTVSVSAVPIPGAVVLFGSGLLGLVAIGRRNARKSARV